MEVWAYKENKCGRTQQGNDLRKDVAEGVAEQICAQEDRDVSGNKKLVDIGPHLKEGIVKYFKENDTAITIKYIDPSYMIRSSVAIPSDSVYCNQLAQNAVHAAMAGKTGMLVGMWNNSFTYVPVASAMFLKPAKRSKNNISVRLMDLLMKHTRKQFVRNQLSFISTLAGNCKETQKVLSRH